MFCDDDHNRSTAASWLDCPSFFSRRSINDLRESVFGLDVNSGGEEARPRQLIIRHLPSQFEKMWEQTPESIPSCNRITTALVVETNSPDPMRPLADAWHSLLDSLPAKAQCSIVDLGNDLSEAFLQQIQDAPECSSNPGAVSTSIVVVAWPDVEVIHGGRNLVYLYQSGCLTKLTAAPVDRERNGLEMKRLAIPSAQRTLKRGARCLLATEGLAQLLSIDELQQFCMRNEHLSAEDACRRLAMLASKKSKATAFSLAVLGGKKVARMVDSTKQSSP